MSGIDEQLARAILAAAIVEGRSGELLDCLFEGGSATIDRDGKLCLASAANLRGMWS
jgi:hypothetical protein